MKKSATNYLVFAILFVGTLVSVGIHYYFFDNYSITGYVTQVGTVNPNPAQLVELQVKEWDGITRTNQLVISGVPIPQGDRKSVV